MSLWLLLGVVLVFFMHCGFAMLETGFVKAKNAGNIIMKNLMNLCIGTFTFMFLGYGIMMGEHTFFGLIGRTDLSLFTSFADFDLSGFIFQLIFCATATTIVSGAMAERTKFSSYCIYAAIISLIIYPIEAGWVWGADGWLANLGFVDFAGSAVIHMFGGIAALIGALFLGPRIGKYTVDAGGKTVSNAIPGHSMSLSALGCLILWFGWYGFNSAAAGDSAEVARIFATTTISPALATLVCMIYTWVKNKKPDVSMCINAPLAGLVGITAGCASVNAVGAAIIGAVSGILVVVAVEFIDQKCHIDDPVGAAAVHGANGIWGTLAVGLFSYNDTYGGLGLFYGGGFHQLGIQAIGVLSIAAFTIIIMTILFKIMKSTIGLRVTAIEEVEGLDLSEHGLASAYADFLPTVSFIGGESGGTLNLKGLQPFKLHLANSSPAKERSCCTCIRILCNEERFGVLRDTLSSMGISGMTVSNVMGCGAQKGKSGHYRGVELSMNLLPKIQVDIVVSDIDPQIVVAAARKALNTGHIGDGKIFVFEIEDVVRVRTGESGCEALQINSAS